MKLIQVLDPPMVGLLKQERPLSLEHEMLRLPVRLKDYIEDGSEYQTPNSGSMDLVESDAVEKPLLKAQNRSCSIFAAELDADVQPAII